MYEFSEQIHWTHFLTQIVSAAFVERFYGEILWNRFIGQNFWRDFCGIVTSRTGTRPPTSTAGLSSRGGALPKTPPESVCEGVGKGVSLRSRGKVAHAVGIYVSFARQ